VFNVADAVDLTSGKPTPVDGKSFCSGESVAIVLMDWAINSYGSQQKVSGRLEVRICLLKEKLHGVFTLFSIIIGGCWSYEYSTLKNGMTNIFHGKSRDYSEISVMSKSHESS